MADAELRAQDSINQDDRHIWCIMLNLGKHFAFHKASGRNDMRIGRLRSASDLDVKHCVLQSVAKLAACE